MLIEDLNIIIKSYTYYLKKNFSVNQESDLEGYNLDDIEDQIFGSISILPYFLRISEEECSYVHFDNIFDCLGYYQKREGENVEGEIVLNKKCIENYALDLKQKGFNLKSRIYPFPYNECVFKIVLFHELGHWITHWMLDKDSKRWGDDFWEITPNPNDLLDGLAQLFTYQAILIDPDFKNLKILFEIMLTGQTDPYHQHSTILKHKNFSWYNVFNALAEIRLESNPTLDSFLNKFNQNPE